jgi:hypothetical protein
MHPHATLRGTLIGFSRAPLNLPLHAVFDLHGPHPDPSSVHTCIPISDLDPLSKANSFSSVFCVRMSSLPHPSTCNRMAHESHLRCYWVPTHFFCHDACSIPCLIITSPRKCIEDQSSDLNLSSPYCTPSHVDARHLQSMLGWEC